MAETKIKIVVNGRGHVTTQSELSYVDIKAMAGYHGFPGVLSMTWSSGPNGPNGILSPGRSVKVTEGMVFNAYDTSNA